MIIVGNSFRGFKRMHKLLFVSLIGLLSISSVFSQIPSTQGTEFWFSFMKNGFRVCNGGYDDDITLIISAKRSCSGTISNINTGWSQNFNIGNNSTISISIPENQGYCDVSETILQKGIRVVSNDTISVYIANEATNSFDAANVLPIQALNDEYITQSYNQSSLMIGGLLCYDNLRSAFLIIATENNTIIDIIPKKQTANGHQPNVQFTITLNEGEVYQVISATHSNAGDLSGSYIKSRDCKKIAVFNGNTLTTIPNLENGFDHIFEAAIPTSNWGKNFAVTSSSTRELDYVKITALKNGTIVRKNGLIVCYLSARSSYTFEINSSQGSCFLQANEPCAVYLYQRTGEPTILGESDGDPSMVWISPIEQKIKEITFTTFSTQEINRHYVNIITASNNISAMRFDGINISSSEFTPLLGNSDLAYTRKNITHGNHTIQGGEEGFLAHVYGFGNAEGYAYSVGSNAINFNQQIFINDVLSSMYPEDYMFCITDSLNFFLQLNYESDSIFWNLGDGTVLEGDTITHEYEEQGIYNIEVIIKHLTVGCSGQIYDTVSCQIVIDDINTTEIYDTICQGLTYNSNGFNFIANEDTIIMHQFGQEIGCDSIINLYLTVHDNYQVTINATICEGETYTLNNFNESMTGTYTHETITQDGCDSITTLNLSVITLTPFMVSGGGAICSDAVEGLMISLSNSELGVEYHIVRDNVFLESIMGTGDAMQIGPYSIVGSYTIKAVNDDCEVLMDGQVTIKNIPKPPERTIQY